MEDRVDDATVLHVPGEEAEGERRRLGPRHLVAAGKGIAEAVDAGARAGAAAVTRRGAYGG